MVKFKYKFSPDYNPRYVNGAIGGINPQGEIIINFYLERNALPHSQSFEITENSVIGQLAATEPEDFQSSFVRFVENGVVMNYKAAKEIHRWLGDHLQKLEQSEIK